MALVVKNLPANARDAGDFLLEEGMATHSGIDRGAWWAMVHRVSESDMTEAA